MNADAGLHHWSLLVEDKQATCDCREVGNWASALGLCSHAWAFPLYWTCRHLTCSLVEKTDACCPSLQRMPGSVQEPAQHQTACVVPLHPALSALSSQLSCSSSHCPTTFDLEPQEAASHEGDSLVISPALRWSPVVEMTKQKAIGLIGNTLIQSSLLK